MILGILDYNKNFDFIIPNRKSIKTFRQDDVLNCDIFVLYRYMQYVLHHIFGFIFEGTQQNHPIMSMVA